MVKHATYQKVESLRAVFLSKLDKTVKSNSIFNTKRLEFSTEWQELFHFNNPSCACNPTYSLHQKYCPQLHTPQKMKFSIKDFFSKCEQIRRKLWRQISECLLFKLDSLFKFDSSGTKSTASGCSLSWQMLMLKMSTH